MTEPQLATGVVKMFNYDSGYGFLVSPVADRDIYFHCSQLPGEKGQRWIEKGTRVSFELTSRYGKPAAKNVRPLDESTCGVGYDRHE